MFISLNAKAVHNGSTKEFYINTDYIVHAYEEDDMIKVFTPQAVYYVSKDEWQFVKKKIETEQRKQLR